MTMAAKPPRNQQIIITQGEKDDYESAITQLKAELAAAPTADAEAIKVQLAAEQAAHAETKSQRDALQEEINQIKAALQKK
jgi:hypothetical protein